METRCVKMGVENQQCIERARMRDTTRTETGRTGALPAKASGGQRGADQAEGNIHERRQRSHVDVGPLERLHRQQRHAGSHLIEQNELRAHAMSDDANG